MTKPTAILGIALAAFCFGCRSSQPTEAAPRQAVGGSTATDQSGDPLLPDRALTPGATLPVAVADIAVPGYTKKVRNVPTDVKRQVYSEYGITSHKPGQYEVDHLISLELGGSNSIKNLWPQSYLTQPWNAHVKDQLENELHDEVCSGRLDLATAQHDISTDWIAAYKKYFHTKSPLSKGGGYDNGVYVGGGASQGSVSPPADRRFPIPRPTLSPGVFGLRRADSGWESGVGQSEIGQVFPAWFVLLRAHETGAVHERGSRPGARVRCGKRAVETRWQATTNWQV